jgi:hypothetical protein
MAFPEGFRLFLSLGAAAQEVAKLFRQVGVPDQSPRENSRRQALIWLGIQAEAVLLTADLS